jgi:primosomal protein N'
MSDKAHVCEHGQLSRSCNICDLLCEIDDLRAKLAKAEKVVEAADRLMNNIRNATSTQDRFNKEGHLERQIKQYRGE